MGETTMNPIQQSEHPHQSPSGDSDAGPKVDAYDSGAEVGTPGSASAAFEEQKAAVDEALAAPDGFIGYNPDPKPNSFYAQPEPGVHNGEDEHGEDEHDEDEQANEPAPPPEPAPA